MVLRGYESNGTDSARVCILCTHLTTILNQSWGPGHYRNKLKMLNMALNNDDNLLNVKISIIRYLHT